MVGRLDNGRSNQSFLLDSSGTRIVLRLNSTTTLLPGANRLAEAEIWQAASARGIAPPLLYVDTQAGFLVSTFIADHLPPQAQTEDTVLDQVFDLLARCHSLEVDVPVMDYAQHIERYWKIINSSGTTPGNTLTRQRGPMLELLESLLNKDTQRGLCHHDPIPANFVGTADRLYLIDWEYAAEGLVVMDYAALGVEWGIADEVVVARSGMEPESLAMAKDLYRYLCALWQAVAAWPNISPRQTPDQVRGDK
ncbi:MAG: hypothetical protein BMS9Abin30_0373 [Gammaproteobacteria bacterium]|nr:MAG: hypothetical protein BMS9Abin30_0373 [Gammaproteobacteria bacterium]